MDKTPPLSPEELDHVLACYRTLKARKADWADLSVTNAVAVELKRAKRKEEAERLQDEALASLPPRRRPAPDRRGPTSAATWTPC